MSTALVTVRVGRKPAAVTWLAGCLLLPGAALAQASDPRDTNPGPLSAPVVPPPTPDRDIVVVGQRIPGSVIGDVNPLAVLDRAALHGLAPTSFKMLLERLKPLTASADGSDPVYLLNGRRISGMADLESLPPEAIERTEILPEREATRFGFPPTVRVTNFITKKHFRAVTAVNVASFATEGAGAANFGSLNTTRIAGPRRLSVNLSRFLQAEVLQSQRGIVPDPATRYSLGGTLSGVGGGSIDPALDALAGRAVRVAALPDSAAARRAIGSYLAGANTAPVSDTGADRSLQQRNETIDFSATLASPIGRSIDGSMTVSLTKQTSAARNGLAPATLSIPGNSGFLPFTSTVLVDR